MIQCESTVQLPGCFVYMWYISGSALWGAMSEPSIVSIIIYSVLSQTKSVVLCTSSYCS